MEANKSETFENWINICFNEKGYEMLDRPLEDASPPHFALSIFIGHYEDTLNEFIVDPVDIYYSYITGASLAYNASHVRKDEKSITFAEEVNQMCQLMYRLDTECVSAEALRPDMSLKEHHECLAALDADREIFKTIVMEALETLKNHRILLEYVLGFAKVIFRFNCYQAPPRTNPIKSALDAAGMTDLFGELIVEIRGHPFGKIKRGVKKYLYPHSTLKNKDDDDDEKDSLILNEISGDLLKFLRGEIDINYFSEKNDMDSVKSLMRGHV